ncbi:scarecrow-like protein 14 isoform X10 [Diospyros lotus]|uniref:scarecrow-like protein 14 isoform X10 n=1 Tax=Diospyros lotus TaxID=55363 RepID=UPI002255F5C9|nr:scarecrow-like protein 14 isoform X10 [Diospyros lotus]XP_052184792.1 scarecrow-like protein 14 isoform X10 [Diospyros lotus]
MNRDHKYMNLYPTSNGPDPTIHSKYLSESCRGDSAETNYFCDSVLKYINQVLMEDDMEDRAAIIQDSTLRVAEKCFYEILNGRYPSSPNLVRPHELKGICQCCCRSSADANNPAEYGVIRSPHVHSPYVDRAFQTLSFSSTSLSYHNVADILNAPSESRSGWQFDGGLENARNILPSENGVTFNFENRLASRVAKDKVWQMKAKLEKDEGDCPHSLLRVRKDLHPARSVLEEGRSNKHLAVDVEESVLHEMFVKVLSFGEPALLTSDADLPTEAGGKSQHYQRAKGFDDEITYTTTGARKKEAVNMRKLLIQCMESVAANDKMKATGLLKQIRLLSSPQGDVSQRLAHYFAHGLEARLTGYRIPEHKLFAVKGLVESDVWKAYKLYVSAFPFMGMQYFVSTQMITELAEKVTSLHIINFGINHGLQWPRLIRSLSKRPGGPPKLRITAIDLPQTGFKPDARVKETGRRLATYCEKFKVPFEYNGFGQNWETVSVEDLKIERGEVLVVNSLNQLEVLLDDIIVGQSPRDAVLNLIRRIDPDIFIHGVVNGTYNTPFFVSRFREALFHFSSWFDMLDANVPRNNQERISLERDIWGQEILNIVAREGLDRVERPETYKQWEVRTVRAGFKQLPLNMEILKEVRGKMESSYHKDFFVEEANQWITYGWKGRALFAIASWKPA